MNDFIRAINSCNQRGGRMLSLIDLLDAGSVDAPLAAYLAAMMRSGVSLLVGAVPGGAGKTAVMCALLNFLPDHTSICTVGSPAALYEGAALPSGENCFLAHEIGRGSYYAYIWGETARAFFRLAGQGQLVATNLHADTLEQTQEQLCQDNGVAETCLAAVALKVFLRNKRTGAWSVRRWISHVYESDGTKDRLLWRGDVEGNFTRLGESRVISREQEETMGDFLEMLGKRDIRRIEDVRQALVRQR